MFSPISVGAYLIQKITGGEDADEEGGDAERWVLLMESLRCDG